MFNLFKRDQHTEQADQPADQPGSPDVDPAVAQHLDELATEIAAIESELENDRLAVLARRRQELLAEQRALQERLAAERAAKEAQVRERRQRFIALKGRAAELLEHNDRVGGWLADWTQTIAQELRRLDSLVFEYKELFVLLEEMRELAAVDPDLADAVPSVELRPDLEDLGDFVEKMASEIATVYRRGLPGTAELRMLKRLSDEQIGLNIQTAISPERLALARNL